MVATRDRDESRNVVRSLNVYVRNEFVVIVEW